MRKLVLIGAGGQLATDIQQRFGARSDVELVEVTHQNFAVEDSKAVQALVERYPHSIVINTAAFHNCNECEEDAARAFAVNATALKALSEACNRTESTLVHFSTDYVFGIDRARRTPYIESDMPGPVNMYGISKFAGEQVIANYCERHFVFRVCGLYGHRKSSAKKFGNFVEMMIHLGQENTSMPSAADQTLTFTSTHAVAAMLEQIVFSDAYGLYHATCEGESRRADFVRAIFREMRIECEIEDVPSSHFNPRYEQPTYSVLENQRLKALGITMPHWEEALREYLRGRP